MTEIEIVSVDTDGGIIKLSDETRWQVAPQHIAEIRGWLLGHQIVVLQRSTASIWKFTLHNSTTGSQVSAGPVLSSA
jgi:hypothetical protein